MMLDRQTNADV